MNRLVFPLLLVASMVASGFAAATAIEEIDLPPGATMPLAIRIDEVGRVWFTLDGTWGVGRYDPKTNETVVVNLSSPKAADSDSLFALRTGPDGSLWTGSMRNLHRIDTDDLSATSFPVPEETVLGGDVYITGDGIVWYAAVTLDKLFRLDIATGSVMEYPLDPKPFGPLVFDPGPMGVYLTATYAGTYAKLDPVSGKVQVGRTGILRAPVGLAHDDSFLWAAEMGFSSVSRIDPKTGQTERFPTSRSPYYPVSGPSGILVGRDGSIWFVEHFADKIARLDPVRRTLHEFEVPSAPGTNVQFLAEAPDGRIWFAEWSTDRIGVLDFTPEEPGFEVPEKVALNRGKAQFTVTIPGEVILGSDDENLSLSWDGTRVLIESRKAQPGDHNVLISSKRGDVVIGRYVSVFVDTTSIPGVGLAALAGIAVVVALATGRRRG